jgi:lipopolysaccharide export system permease LptF/LptG-like protein
MTKGRRLRQWATRVCSSQTVERLIDPVIADLQHEYERAKANGHALRTAVLLLRGYWAFWTVLTIHVPGRWLHRTLSGFRASHQQSFVRAVVPAAIALITVSAALIVEPARHINQSGIVGTWLLILLLPQSIPFSIPLSIFTGIVWGQRSRPVTRQIRRTAVVLGLAGTLLSASTIVWVVPFANQAFRTIIARRVILEGPGEMSPRELREYALALRSQGRTAKAGDILLSYHARWAIAGAALVFAIFGLGVATLRLGPIATVLVAATSIVVYVSYFDQLGNARSSAVFSHEGLAVTFAWLPNFLILLTSMAFLTKRDDALPAQGA